MLQQQMPLMQDDQPGSFSTERSLAGAREWPITRNRWARLCCASENLSGDLMNKLRPVCGDVQR